MRKTKYWKKKKKKTSLTCIAQLRTPIQLFQQIMCLLVILNSKTRYPKGALQQMEVEIVALYITMHITLQRTGRPRVWSWRYGFKYGYWLICTLFHNCLQFQDIHVFCFLLLFFSPFSSSLLFQTRNVWEQKEKKKHQTKCHNTEILWLLDIWSTYSHHRYLLSRPTVKRESASLSYCTQLFFFFYKRKISKWIKQVLRPLHRLRLENSPHLPWFASSKTHRQSWIILLQSWYDKLEWWPISTLCKNVTEVFNNVDNKMHDSNFCCNKSKEHFQWKYQNDFIFQHNTASVWVFFQRRKITASVK